MNETLFVVLIGTLGFASTCLGLWKDYKDKRYTKRWWKGLKKEFFILIGIGICILSLSIWQYFYATKENNKEKRFALIEQKKNDSIMQNEIKKGIDSSIQIISQGFGKSFKEQGIKMDSLNFTLVKIKDSVNSNRSQVPEERPTLEIFNKGVILDPLLATKRSLKITLTSVDAGATNFEIKISIINLYENGNLVLELTDDELFDKMDRIPKGTSKTLAFFAPIDAKIKKVYLLLKGTYTNLNGKNKTAIDALYEYIPEEEVTMKMFTAKRNEILSKLKLE